MPKQFGEILKSLAGKAKIKLDDETLKKLLSFTDAAQFELPDEIANAFEQNLLTEDSATANTNVRSKIFAEALNGVDAELDTMLGDFEFDDAFKTTYKGIQKNTNEKVRKLKAGLQDQLKAAKEKAKNSGNPNDKAEVDALKAQIADLNKKQSDRDLLHKTELENLKLQNLNDRKDYTLRSTLSGKPLPKNGLSQDINILTAKTLINQEMAKHGLVFYFDDNGNAVLKQKKDGAEIDYYVDNKSVNFDQFIDGVLAQNKFVQVNEPNPQNPGPVNNPQPTPGNPTNSTIAAEIGNQLAMLGTTV